MNWCLAEAISAALRTLWLGKDFALTFTLQELPEQWNNTKKLAISIKQQVAPLQANEVANIRRKLGEFDVRQHEFREDFRKISAFAYNCANPYDELDKVDSVAVY